jgi:prolyl-tRNA editing enzyme YbaK/EbsC (Cys-tRNA(Pro) deacylase)
MAKPVAEHASVVRVRTELTAQGFDDRIEVLADSTRTAVEAAAALGVEVGQIASSVMFHVDDNPVLVVISGAQRVDVRKLASLFGDAQVTKPNAQQVRAATGFAIGGVAPIAHPTPISVLVDLSLAPYAEVWAAAGHPYAVFATSHTELLELTKGRSVSVQEG